MKYWGCILAIVIGCSACRVQKDNYYCKRDSVKVVEIVQRDTEIIVQKDSSWLEALLECDSTGQVLLKEITAYRAGNHLGVPWVKIEDNRLTAKANTDSFGIYLSLKDKYEKIIRSDIVYAEKVREVFRTTWWQKCLIYSGVFSVICFIIRRR